MEIRRTLLAAALTSVTACCLAGCVLAPAVSAVFHRDGPISTPEPKNFTARPQDTRKPIIPDASAVPTAAPDGGLEQADPEFPAQGDDLTSPNAPGGGSPPDQAVPSAPNSNDRGSAERPAHPQKPTPSGSGSHGSTAPEPEQLPSEQPPLNQPNGGAFDDSVGSGSSIMLPRVEHPLDYENESFPHATAR